MLVGSDEPVTGAGIVPESKRLAGEGNVVGGTVGSRGERAGLQIVRTDFDPRLRAELGIEGDRVFICISDRFGLEALARLVEVRVKQAVAERDLVKAVLTGDKEIAVIGVRLPFRTERFDLDLIVGKFNGDVLLAVVCGDLIVALNGKIPGRGRYRSVPFQIGNSISVVIVVDSRLIIRLQIEHADRLGVDDLFIVIVEAVFVEGDTYAAAGNEHGMLERPASLRGRFRIIVNAVQRMHVTYALVQERIRLLRIVRGLQMAGQYVIVPAAGI